MEAELLPSFLQHRTCREPTGTASGLLVAGIANLGSWHSQSAAENPGMRMPQEENKLAPGNLWPKEGEEPGAGENQGWATPGLTVSLDSPESLSKAPRDLVAHW